MAPIVGMMAVAECPFRVGCSVQRPGSGDSAGSHPRRPGGMYGNGTAERADLNAEKKRGLKILARDGGD